MLTSYSCSLYCHGIYLDFLMNTAEVLDSDFLIDMVEALDSAFLVDMVVALDHRSTLEEWMFPGARLEDRLHLHQAF